MSNPFADDEATAVAVMEPEDLDLDVDTADAPEDTVEDTVEETKEEKPAKAKGPTRPPVPEGYISPVAAAKELTKHEQAKGRLAESDEVRPQIVYSYMRNNQSGKSKNPILTYCSVGTGENTVIYPTGEAPEGAKLERENLLKLEEFLAWWDAKVARVDERKANAAVKAEKAKAKAEAAPTEAEATTTEAPAEAE